MNRENGFFLKGFANRRAKNVIEEPTLTDGAPAGKNLVLANQRGKYG